MVLTWTFYPRHSERISLKVTYLPKLDKPGVWGFLHVDSNHAWVSWDCFKIFDSGDTRAKREAFERMSRIETENYKVPDGLPYLVVPIMEPLSLTEVRLGVAAIQFRRSASSPNNWEFDDVY
ncbi:MAG: hypothetical protein ABIN80_22970 [Dyadobacter sp.]|uniref:hypothetical protein n=1 Tax=Dyadobacter sp. TaxID=1914288 RepID=UPI003264D3C8